MHYFLDKEKCVLYYGNLQLDLRLGLKPKNCIAYYNSVNHNGWNHVLNSTRKKNKTSKNGDRDRKALYKSMTNVIYRKAIENLRKWINIRLVNNKKDFLKWTSKPSYMSLKLFDNDLVAIRKGRVTLTLNKHVHIGMCILELSKVWMQEIHYDYIKNKYENNSRPLFTDDDSLLYEIKTKYIYEDFSSN